MYFQSDGLAMMVVQRPFSLPLEVHEGQRTKGTTVGFTVR